MDSQYASGMHKKYPVRMTDTERNGLQELIAAGTAPARLLMHARIPLKADQSPNGPAGRRCRCRRC